MLTLTTAITKTDDALLLLDKLCVIDVKTNTVGVIQKS